jgi:RHS repeat-associated protein
MANISYRAASTLTNRYGWNGGNEYEDEGELNYSNTFYRKYDAQIGRFTGIDMLAENYVGINPYQFGANNPVMFNDPMGDRLKGLMEKGPDNNYHVSWVNEMLWVKIGFYNGTLWGDESDGGGSGGNYRNAMGMSSSSILSQMVFGQQFGQNKNGDYGFWSKYNFSPTDRGYNEAGRNGNTLVEVSVGSGRRWTALGGLEGGPKQILIYPVIFLNPSESYNKPIFDAIKNIPLDKNVNVYAHSTRYNIEINDNGVRHYVNSPSSIRNAINRNLTANASMQWQSGAIQIIFHGCHMGADANGGPGLAQQFSAAFPNANVVASNTDVSYMNGFEFGAEWRYFKNGKEIGYLQNLYYLRKF